MNTIAKHIVFVSALLSLITFSPCRAGQTLPQNHALDGTWWLSVSYDERLGFLEGEAECYIDEYKGSDKYSYSFDLYVQMLTERYSGSSLDDRQSVVAEIHKLRDNPGRSFVDPYAQPSDGPPTGLEWLQMDAVAQSDMESLGVEHRGFVEGYLACHAELNHSKGGFFSNSAEAYVNDIDQWYGYVRSTGDMNPGREDTPITKVLFMFSDKSGASKPNGG